MSTPIWVTLVVVGIAVIAGVTLVNHFVDQNRLRKTRELSALVRLLHRCWASLDDVPPQYLPMALRSVVAKIMLVHLRRGLRISPESETLLEQSTRIGELVSAPDGVAMVNPLRRLDIRRQLLSLRGICIEAAMEGIISHSEYAGSESLANALALRVQVDYHLDAAGGALRAKSFDEAITLLDRALTGLKRLSGSDNGPEQTQVVARIAEAEQQKEEHRVLLEREAEEALERNWAAPPLPLHRPESSLRDGTI